MAGREVLTVAQMQAAEQAVFDQGTSVDELMRIAGEGAAEWVWRIAAGRSVTVLCGPGNNGGDGYVIAEALRKRGLAVGVVAPVEPKTDAARNARSNYRGEVRTAGNGTRGDVLVDCLFGSGLARPLSGEHALMLRDLAERHHHSVAIDLPSGVESDTGALLNERLPHYDLTLALGAWKFAHWRLPARAAMGEIKLIEIGVPPTPGAAQLITRPRLNAPEAESHKYRRGLCAVVGGAMPGASILASKAAMRAGAGYVKLLSDNWHDSAPASLVIDDNMLEDALADERLAAVLIGPGLGRGEIARDRLACALESKVAAVLDADALHLIDSGSLPSDVPLLATPHDGELDALCRTFSVVASGRQDRAQALAKVSGMVILAKGPDTIVAAPDGRLALAPPASSWLSSAGTGDVLAGIAVSRMATGRDAFTAACEAVWLHGEAARQAGPAFTADELAHCVSGAIAAAL
ncbi:NAD(P)H-hydrate dehydratase [Altererythrobacter arenosus]|uniref:Bifunctional NAD(P)H-hydrate repair enzyme n=1 Tax=Altererythrobacter arenosus TaxID=3032592 RepID=A0ABY8FQA5_9SPHN|nr:NAD(P)H-hydrate dehydratase [Altererythrobacter sp. CAU 1644]WFL77199.1 NAD(P)H-hydrate dehydratase [Altererythrobacter sp. CAU 1644]